MGIRFIVLGCLLALAGCAATTPGLDARFGESTMTMKARQTREPAAAVTNANKSVDGLEARATSESMDRYYKSFAAPQPPMTVINIGVPGR